MQILFMKYLMIKRLQEGTKTPTTTESVACGGSDAQDDQANCSRASDDENESDEDI